MKRTQKPCRDTRVRNTRVLGMISEFCPYTTAPYLVRNNSDPRPNGAQGRQLTRLKGARRNQLCTTKTREAQQPQQTGGASATDSCITHTRVHAGSTVSVKVGSGEGANGSVTHVV